MYYIYIKCMRTISDTHLNIVYLKKIIYNFNLIYLDISEHVKINKIHMIKVNFPIYNHMN